jgi:hypothetical protein
MIFWLVLKLEIFTLEEKKQKFMIVIHDYKIIITNMYN